MLSPHRADRHFGSFRVNTVTGRWSDFAASMAGSDVVSLVAYLTNSSQSAAARALISFMGVHHG